jgi:hypothetical protein
MDSATIARYQPNGDFYATLVAQYGTASANAVAAAAATGDNNGEVNAALADARTRAGITKGEQDASTLDALGNQLATDPLGAPLAGLNNVVGNTFFSFLKNKWVVGALVLGIFLAAGGGQFAFRLLKGKLSK